MLAHNTKHQFTICCNPPSVRKKANLQAVIGGRRQSGRSSTLQLAHRLAYHTVAMAEGNPARLDLWHMGYYSSCDEGVVCVFMQAMHDGRQLKQVHHHDPTNRR